MRSLKAKRLPYSFSQNESENIFNIFESNMKLSTIALSLLSIVSTLSVTSAKLGGAKKAGKKLDQKNIRDLLSIDDASIECLNETSKLESYFIDVLAAFLLAGSKNKRFCQKGDGIMLCDAKTYRFNTMDGIEFKYEDFQARCEDSDGLYREIDTSLSEGELIKNLPTCWHPICGDQEYEMIAAFKTIVFSSTEFGVSDDRFSPKYCDERADAKFFVRYKEGETKVMTCEDLSYYQEVGKFPMWVSKDPCEKNWSPVNEFPSAPEVCPTTCKVETCIEEENTEWVKDIDTGSTRTCKWLESLSDEKKRKMCSRKHYRIGGKYPVPSARSACPKTCKGFDM